MKVELTLDEKAGPIPILATLDIVILILVLGFVVSGLAHRPGLAVTMGLSHFRASAAEESVVLTIKGAVEPVLYLDSRPVQEAQLAKELVQLRDQGGIRMVLVKGDVRLAAQVQNRLSELILSQGLECVWIAEAGLAK